MQGSGNGILGLGFGLWGWLGFMMKEGSEIEVRKGKTVLCCLKLQTKKETYYDDYHKSL